MTSSSDGRPAMVVARPPFDPECEAALEAVRESVVLDVTPDRIPWLRERTADARVTDEELVADGLYALEERSVPGPPGDPDLSVLICTPKDAAGPVPVLYHLHGGGMIAGDKRSLLEPMYELARANGMAVVSIDYRLAPEHADPAPVEDCYAGLVWLAENAVDLGFDLDRIVLVGVSAGGGLAAGTALLARDRGYPALHGQMLISPMLDDRNDSTSAQQMAGVGVWDRAANETGWRALLGERHGSHDVSIYTAPGRCTNLAGVPATFVEVGSAETFRDEAVAFACGIWTAGGRAELHVWPGAFHGFDVVAPYAAISQATIATRVAWLHRLLEL